MFEKNELMDLSDFYNNQIHTRKLTDKLGRYYTPISIAEILCELVGKVDNQNIIDLGCGCGNLILGSYKSWKNCTYHAYDIDTLAINRLASFQKKNIFTYNMDIINGNIPYESFDIGISNPPYIYFSKEKILEKLKSETSLEKEIIKLNRIPAPLIFLTKILSAVKKNGKVGLIFPNGLLVNKAYKNIRKILLNEYKINTIIKLEPYVFDSTETYAHLLIIENSVPENKYPIQFYELVKNKLINPALRSNISCYERMDYFLNRNPQNNQNLSNYIETIFRGNVSSKFIKENPNRKIFHTTNFNNNEKNFLSITSNSSVDTCIKYAQKNDILIARVGRHFYKKIKIVDINNLEISDSIIVIRPKKNKTKFIYKILTSNDGQEYLKTVSQGTGAKYITHDQILNLPLNMEDIHVF